MTKSQLEKKYNINLVREQNPYMGGRLFWSVKDLNGKYWGGKYVFCI